MRRLALSVLLLRVAADVMVLMLLKNVQQPPKGRCRQGEIANLRFAILISLLSFTSPCNIIIENSF